MEIAFVNLTRHTINELVTNLSIPPSGLVARLNHTTSQTTELDGIPVYSKQFGEVQNLPDSEPNTYYIVSGIILDHAKTMGRTDCLAPAELVRNKDNQVIGCKGFIC
jgi:hypothetical protein